MGSVSGLVMVAMVAFCCHGCTSQFVNDIEECFKRDSISCLQIQVYRNVKSFFDVTDINLFGGFSLVKEEKAGQASRSLDYSVAEKDILQSNDIEQREEALESYAIGKVRNIFEERSLRFNLSPVFKSIKSVVDSLSPEIRDKITQFMTEGRGKKKKLLQSLLPLIVAGKLKLGALLALSYLGTALVAKKAIVVSLVAIAISAFIGLKKLLYQQHGVHDTHAYAHSHSHVHEISSPGAHSLAYSAHKPVRR